MVQQNYSILKADEVSLTTSYETHFLYMWSYLLPSRVRVPGSQTFAPELQVKPGTDWCALYTLVGSEHSYSLMKTPVNFGITVEEETFLL